MLKGMVKRMVRIAKDLLKVIHYGIIALHINNMENLNNESK